MRGSRHQKLIWIGPTSENVSLRVISFVAKFHAFIIYLNNSVFFWSITAGLAGLSNHETNNMQDEWLLLAGERYGFRMQDQNEYTFHSEKLWCLFGI